MTRPQHGGPLRRVEVRSAHGDADSAPEIIRHARVWAMHSVVVGLRRNGWRVCRRQEGKNWYERCRNEPFLPVF